MSGYDAMFRRATDGPGAEGGLEPYPYQRALATADALPDVLDVPTGAGKTAAVVLAWLWRRRFAEPGVRADTPRRLIYCLPSRTLVRQTTDCVQRWMNAAASSGDSRAPVTVHSLIGGAVDADWAAKPEADVVIVGTQDQLLSRAMNRGYSTSRYMWPVHYALVNNDALWVLDETQLMGVGVSTAAQLAALRDRWGTWAPSHTIWMSATMSEGPVRTVDFGDRALVRHGLSDEDREDRRLAPILGARRRLDRAQPMSGDARGLANEIVSAHDESTRTLVVVNRVERAQALFKAIEKLGVPVALLHSRYRAPDRRALEERVLAPGWEGVLVTTQTVEAGVDISSRTLFTELAPWSSIVQRVGRCNRRGEFDDDRPARVVWVDVADDDGSALPYTVGDLQTSRARLLELHELTDQVLRSVPAQTSRPASPVIRAPDLLDFFDTTRELGGSDIDVSRYVRDAGAAEVSIAWRELGPQRPSDDARRPSADEVCRVPMGKRLSALIKTAVGDKRPRCYRYDPLASRWVPERDPRRLVPGSELIADLSLGGYDARLGWTGRRSDVPAAVQGERRNASADSTGGERRSKFRAPHRSDVTEADDDDTQSVTRRFVTLRVHADDAAEEVRRLRERLSLDLPWDEIERAARWHDVGKAHAQFQEMLTSGAPERRGATLWAKSDGTGGRRTRRPYFRHELASALALLAHGASNLTAYLALAHHGKVRMTIRSRPKEQAPRGRRRFALGVYDGDELPEVDLGAGVTTRPVQLSLEVMELGGSEEPSWSTRAQRLLERFGPFRLAYLETLVRVADWRASARRDAAAEGDGDA